MTIFDGQANLQVLGNMRHQLLEDPMRRFTFAFTVADTNMRLWFASRSEILASQAFDFVNVSIDAGCPADSGQS